MHEDELRALIRDAIARHLGTALRRRQGRLWAEPWPAAPSPACLENAPVARPLRVPGPDRTRRPVRGRTRRCAVTTAGSASRTATEGPAPQRHVDHIAPARLRLAPTVPGNPRPDRAARRDGRLRSERQPVARGTRSPGRRDVPGWSRRAPTRSTPRSSISCPTCAWCATWRSATTTSTSRPRASARSS